MNFGGKVIGFPYQFSFRIEVTNYSRRNFHPIASLIQSAGKLHLVELKQRCANWISTSVDLVLRRQKRDRKRVPACLLPHPALRTIYHIRGRLWRINSAWIKSAFSLEVSR